jgi:replicative DNA helicase
MLDQSKDFMRADFSLPNSYSVEQAVLKSFFADPYLVKDFLDELDPKYFLHPAHAQIINCMIDLAQAHQIPEKDLVFSYLESREQKRAYESAQQLASLAPLDFEEGHDLLEQKLQHLESLNLMRLAIQKSQEIIHRAMGMEVSELPQLIEHIEKSYTELTGQIAQTGPLPLAEAIRETLDELDRIWNQGKSTGVNSGFRELDDLTSGLQRSDFIILAARPAMGKTAFALNIARHVALETNEKKNILFFSLEMSRLQISQRLLSMIGGFNSVNFRNSRFSSEDIDRLNEVARLLSIHHMHIDDTSGLSIFEVMARSRSFARQMGGQCDLVLIDYLQLMNGGTRGGALTNREQEIRLISSSLKGLAKELNCPIVALSQLNRSLEQRPDKRPKPSDLRESGALEQDADLILFLYRDEVYHKETDQKNIAELIISKNRHGPLKTIFLKFNPEIMNFGDMDSSVFQNQF